MRQRSRPFGTWPSPLKPDFAAMAGRRFGQVQSDGGWIYWTESRPEEQGRQVIMRATLAGEVEEVLPAPFSARSRVHEYGGGEFLVADGMVVFVNAADQDLYILSAAPAGVSGQTPARLTHAPGHRFADMALDRRRNRLLAVCERTDATESGAAPPENLIVAIALDGQRRGKIVDLVRGSDFYAAPRLRYD
ncbi:MAG: S9 family peptidase, partial [Hyphomicrobiaceae bacterium]